MLNHREGDEQQRQPISPQTLRNDLLVNESAEETNEAGEVSDDDVQFDEEQMMDKNEEMIRPRVALDPGKPSKEEVAMHAI